MRGGAAGWGWITGKQKSVRVLILVHGTARTIL